MTDGITTVAGITVPSTDPLFLSIVALHVPAGLIAAVVCAIAMLSPKRAGRIEPDLRIRRNPCD